MIEPRRWERNGSRGLFLVLATWGLFFTFLWPRMLAETSDGLVAGWWTVWSDWAAHFAYANVFAYRSCSQWLAHNPLFAGLPFNYPFLVNLISGCLMRLGLSRVDAFIYPSFVTTIFFLVVCYRFLFRILRSSAEAYLALTLFLTGGGLGFFRFFFDVAEAPGTAILLPPDRAYTDLPDFHIRWLNVITSQMLPQRAFLLGFPAALLVLHIILGWIEASGGHDRAPGRMTYPKVAALGAASSLLILTHVHSYLALVIVCAVLFCRYPRLWRHELVFALAASVPSAALFLLLHGSLLHGGGGFFRWYPGWLAQPQEGNPIGWMKFWLLNWGIFLPLAGLAAWRTRLYREPVVIAGVLIFILCNLFKFQPWAWDNTKLLAWSYLFLSIPVARYLVRLTAKPELFRLTAAACLLVFITASGVLDLWYLARSSANPSVLWSRQEMELSKHFRDMSAPTDVVLTADYHHNWVASLAGRQVLMGYRGWLASYGIDFRRVEGDMRTMFSGASGAAELLRQYHVRFVVIGPHERESFGANVGFFERTLERVWTDGPYLIYRVRS